MTYSSQECFLMQNLAYLYSAPFDQLCKPEGRYTGQEGSSFIWTASSSVNVDLRRPVAAGVT